jgi:hypothetical protein
LGRPGSSVAPHPGGGGPPSRPNLSRFAVEGTFPGGWGSSFPRGVTAPLAGGLASGRNGPLRRRGQPSGPATLRRDCHMPRGGSRRGRPAATRAQAIARAPGRRARSRALLPAWACWTVRSGIKGPRRAAWKVDPSRGARRGLGTDRATGYVAPRTVWFSDHRSSGVSRCSGLRRWRPTEPFVFLLHSPDEKLRRQAALTACFGAESSLSDRWSVGRCDGATLVATLVARWWDASTPAPTAP